MNKIIHLRGTLKWKKTDIQYLCLIDLLVFIGIKKVAQRLRIQDCFFKIFLGQGKQKHGENLKLSPRSSHLNLSQMALFY